MNAETFCARCGEQVSVPVAITDQTVEPTLANPTVLDIDVTLRGVVRHACPRGD